MQYRLNVLSQRTDITTDDAISEVAAMINASGNRSQRRKLTKALNKTENILSKCQNKVDRSSYKEYQNNLDVMMLRFYSVLGIVLKNKYNFDEDKEEISTMFETLNTYLEEYRDLSSEDVAKICYETTGIELIGDK